MANPSTLLRFLLIVVCVCLYAQVCAHIQRLDHKIFLGPPLTYVLLYLAIYSST